MMGCLLLRIIQFFCCIYPFIQQSFTFCILDLQFDLVIGIPWLCYFNPRISWEELRVKIKYGNRQLQLPSVFQSYHKQDNSVLDLLRQRRLLSVKWAQLLILLYTLDLYSTLMMKVNATILIGWPMAQQKIYLLVRKTKIC